MVKHFPAVLPRTKCEQIELQGWEHSPAPTIFLQKRQITDGTIFSGDTQGFGRGLPI